MEKHPIYIQGFHLDKLEELVKWYNHLTNCNMTNEKYVEAFIEIHYENNRNKDEFKMFFRELYKNDPDTDYSASTLTVTNPDFPYGSIDEDYDYKSMRKSKYSDTMEL